jgi:heterodisulfide reductase subunit A
VRKKARYVDATKCTACGACVEKCPTKVPNDFDMGLGKRKAIYMYFAQGIPAVMTIDPEKCIYHKRIRAGKKPACQNCEKVCEAGAVDFGQKDEEVTIEVGAVIVATGLELVDAKSMGQYGYGRYRNVVTALEYERLMSASGPTAGHLKRPSDDELPKSVAFLQCVGSRDLSHNRYCSSVCCMHSIKEAILTRDHYPEMDVAIYYMDLRAVGKWFHKYRVRGQEQYGIRYIKGRVSHIDEDAGQNLVVHYEEVTSDRIAKETFGMVVLATGLRPGRGAAELSRLFGFELDEYGFVKTDPLEPLDTTVPGIYVAGYAQSPKDIPETVAQTSGAAQRAAEKVLGAVAAK